MQSHLHMNELNKHLSVLAGLAVAALFTPAPARAQATDWPARTVTVIVAFAAGGNSDILARMVTGKLSEGLKQSFVVENCVGAGGAIAAQHVARAEPDGYTLFFAAAPTIGVLPKIQKVGFDPAKDFAPISVFATGPFFLIVNASIPANTVAEFVEYAKTRKINFGSGGLGSNAHLSAAVFLARAGLDAVHIPFRGNGPAIAALLGGQVDMVFGNASEVVPLAESGKVKILGVAAERRLKQLPNVPTISETYPNSALPSWNGLMAPARTPTPIINKVAEHVIAAARDPAIIEQLRKLGLEPNGTTPEDFAAQIKREQPQFDAAIEAANLKRE